MKRISVLLSVLLCAALLGAGEKPVNFVPATNDPIVGDYAGDSGPVAQIAQIPGKGYQATLLKAFDTEDKPIAVMAGDTSKNNVTFSGDGWSGTIAGHDFIVNKEDQRLDLKHVDRPSPTLGAAPPAGAVVLFDGKNLDAWATKAGKDWLTEAGPAKWKLVDGGAVEVVPGTDCLISHQKFGDCHVHVEFRNLGSPTNSGVFLETRYEVNINETYGKTEGTPNAGLDNCTENSPPKIRASRPPLAWQTLDIDFHAPKFDASGAKTEPARATVLLNGVRVYQDQKLDQPHGAASRLGEAPTGPLMLQEHGMPVQFRNIWVVETKPAT